MFVSHFNERTPAFASAFHFYTTNLKDREVFHKDSRPTGAGHFSRAVARTGWRPCRPVPLTSKIVKFFTKIRDQREQTISAER
jgi:hypothetical protein